MNELTPVSSTVHQTNQLREKRNKLLNDISEIRLQLKALLPYGQLGCRALNAQTKIHRMREQTEKITAAIDALQHGANFYDKQFASFFSFLETQVAISAWQTGDLYDGIRTAKIENVGNSGDELFRAVSVNSDLTQDGNVRSPEEFVNKRRTVECLRAEWVVLEEEIDRMIEKRQREKDLYTEFAQETDRRDEERARLMKLKQAELDDLLTKVNKLEMETFERDLCNSKMEKAKNVCRILKESGGNRPFLKSSVAFFATLQSPSHTDDQVRAAFDELLSVAKMEADVESRTEEQPLRVPTQKISISKTIEELKARIALHQTKL